jgi:hypothetical protein
VADLVSTTLGVAETLKLGSDVVEAFLARRGPIRRLERKVRTDLNQDATLEADRRADAVRVVMSAHVDPECVGSFLRYLHLGEPQAIDDLRRRFSELLESDEPLNLIVSSVERRAPEVLPNEARPTFEGRVTRSELVRAIQRETAPTAEGVESANAKLDLLLERVQGSPSIMLLEWAPERRRRELAEIAEGDADGVAQLDSVMDDLDEEARPREAAKLLLEPPSWLSSASPRLQGVVIRFAEAGGLWDVSTESWEEVGDRYRELGETAREMDALLNSSIAAQLSGDRLRRDELISLVRSEEPAHPRLLMEDLAEMESATDRFELIESIEAGTDDDRALLACHRGIASLMADDLDGAADALEQATRLGEDRVQTQLLRINVAVERGRFAVRTNQRIPLAEIREAAELGRETRERLLRQARYEESMRTLMMMSDATLLTSGPTDAAQLLAGVSPEELDAAEAPEVMGEAALRIQAPLLALAVTDASSESPDVRRIRAAALTRLEPSSDELVLEACGTLDELLTEDGTRGELAALMRLVACLHSEAPDWSDPADQRIERELLREAIPGVRTIYEARRNGLAAADAVVERSVFRSEREKREASFNAALEAEALSDAADRARELLEVGTDQINRHLCAKAIASSDPDRSRAEAQALLDDPEVPTYIRRAMHKLKVQLAVDAEDWPSAARMVDDWLTEMPRDDVANWLRTSIARNISTGAGG